MTRKERRALRARAKAVAKVWAVGCLGRPETGDVRLIDHPKAIQALERAFCIMLQNGGEPQAFKIPEETARTFPGDQLDMPGASYLSVGLDVNQRGTYKIGKHMTVGVDPQTAEIMNREAAKRSLIPHLLAEEL